MSDPQIEPEFIQVRSTDGWITIARSHISSIKKFAANGYALRMDSGLLVHLYEKEAKKLLRVLGVSKP